MLISLGEVAHVPAVAWVDLITPTYLTATFDRAVVEYKVVLLSAAPPPPSAVVETNDPSSTNLDPAHATSSVPALLIV